MKKKKLKIRLSLSGALMIFALFFTHSYISIAALLASALHEISHILAAKICKIPLCELKLGIFGAALRPTISLLSYKKEIFLAIAGPFSNILCALPLIMFVKEANSFCQLFISASLFLGFLNLLPITDFDGGRILYCLIAYKFSPTSALKTIKILSFLLVFILWTLSIYLLLKLSTSLSLFIFSLSLFTKLFLPKEKSNF